MAKRLIVLLVCICFSLALVAAYEFGYNDPTLPQLSQDLFGGVNSSYFMPNNMSVFGNFSFNQGWENGGLSIIDGDLYAQTGYFYNITSLNVTQQNLTINDNLWVTNNGYFGTKLGIGTSSPLFTVHAQSSFGSYMFEDTNGAVRFRLFNSESSPGADTTLARIQFEGEDSTGVQTTYSSIRGLVENSINGAEAGYMVFRTINSGSSDERMRIDASGNVGINTTDPQNLLNVAGDGNFTGNLYGNVIYQNGNIVLDSTDNTTIYSYIDSQDTTYNNTLKAYLDAQNIIFNHSIGNYSDAQDVTYNDSMKSYVDAWNTSQASWATNTFVDISGDTMTGALNLSTINPNDYGNLTVDSGTFFVDSVSNRLGIGTSSPFYELHILDTGAADITIETSGTFRVGLRLINDAQQWRVLNNNDYKFQIRDFTAVGRPNPFQIEPATPENTLYLNSSGNVGIGTASPQNVLNVIGSINQSGNGNITGNNIYGEMWFHNDTAPNVTAIASANVWYNLSALNGQEQNGGTNNGFIKNDTLNSLVAKMDGAYMAVFHITGTGGANNVYHAVVAINNIPQNNTEGHDRVSSPTDRMDLNGNGILTLNAEDMIHLQILNEDAGNDFSVYSAGINLVRIGN